MKDAITKRVVRIAKIVCFPAVMLSFILTAVVPTEMFAQPKDQPVGPQLKLVLARQSTADPVQIMKHLSQKCPNISITTNPKNSDYMLYAGGWSGGYRFMVIAKGGDTIYATEAALLSNAVKNVCKFLDTR